MAIPYKEIFEKINNPVFTKDELDSIHEVEVFIDNSIINSYDGVCLYIHKNIPRFMKKVNQTHNVKFHQIRRELMNKELISRYEKNGWTFIDDNDHIKLIGNENYI